MKIGVLGSGVVGKVLADGFIKHGNKVMIGTRDVAKLAGWATNSNVSGSAGSFSEAAAFGDLLVLAVKGNIAAVALSSAGENNISGKTIIDATNPIADESPENGVLKFFTDINYSLMEKLQSQFPKANFVKAFNSVGNAVMVNPDFGGIKPSMFICGNNDDAKKEAAALLDLFGFETEDMGKAEAARAIEPLCMLWCIPGFNNNSWNHAFKLIKK